MKRLKRVTKREAKAIKKFLKEMNKDKIVPERKPVKVEGVISLTEYLKRQALKKAEKLVFRQERRQLKEAEKNKKPAHDHEGHNHEEHNHEESERPYDRSIDTSAVEI